MLSLVTFNATQGSCGSRGKVELKEDGASFDALCKLVLIGAPSQPGPKLGTDMPIRGPNFYNFFV